jgi:hypothetical protein
LNNHEEVEEGDPVTLTKTVMICLEFEVLIGVKVLTVVFWVETLFGLIGGY